MNSIYDSRILNLVIFSPLLVAGLLAFLPKNEKGQIRALTLGGICTDDSKFIRRDTEHGRHAPDADRHRLLHERAPRPDRPHRVGKGQGTGSHEG